MRVHMLNLCELCQRAFGSYEHFAVCRRGKNNTEHCDMGVRKAPSFEAEHKVIKHHRTPSTLAAGELLRVRLPLTEKILGNKQARSLHRGPDVVSGFKKHHRYFL